MDQKISGGFLCPLCLNGFNINHLNPSSSNYLTLEDVPPKSLGGKPLTLTCKSCNSVAGHELDAHLLRRLEELDSLSFLQNSKSNTRFELNGNKVNGVIEVDDNGKIILDLQPRRSNPQEFNQFLSDLTPSQTLRTYDLQNGLIERDKFQTPKFHIKFNQGSLVRRAEIGLLRVAYLLAFSTFGNGFLVNNQLSRVRKQILNPDKEILPKVFWINYEFPRELEGISVISKPDRLRSFLVIFRLQTKSVDRQFAVALPGPSLPGIDIYNNIQNDLCEGGKESFINCQIEVLPKLDYLKEMNLAMASMGFWWEHGMPH